MDSIAINEFPQHTSFGDSDSIVISGANEEALVPFVTMKEAIANAISGDIQGGTPSVAMSPSELDSTKSKVWLYAGETTTAYKNGYIYYWIGAAWQEGNYYGQTVDYATDADVNSIISILEG